MKKLLTSAILAASLLASPNQDIQANPPLHVVHTPQMQQQLERQYEQRRHEQRIRASYGNEPVRYNYQRMNPQTSYYGGSFNNPTFFNPMPYNPYYRKQCNRSPFNAPHCFPRQHPHNQRPQIIIQFNF